MKHVLSNEIGNNRVHIQFVINHSYPLSVYGLILGFNFPQTAQKLL